MNLSVGILSAPKINFLLKGNFHNSSTGRIYTGEYSIFRERQDLFLSENGKTEKITLPFTLGPAGQDESYFELTDVVIGIDFHWERKENQQFDGSLKFIEDNGELTAVNILDIEDYLLSVITSEMSATSSLELLKAHAIISRSWLIAQKDKAQALNNKKNTYSSCLRTPESYIRWFDREDHLNFDVCADDHCQRYQGISRITSPLVKQAIEETRGMVLIADNKICDTRFSKCCGGISERFENVWEPVSHSYLTNIYDSRHAENMPDLTKEEQTDKWINSKPDVFCNTTDPAILSEVLNDYDQETANFFRWEVHYSQKEISELVRERLGIDFGLITDLIPIERGQSGRLIRLKIVGTLKSLTIGKELIIRKAFSKSHLYSSAFTVQKHLSANDITGFTLKGAGWGHGVGLCQIGAAVMGHQGYSYKEILMHYFKNSEIKTLNNAEQ